MMSTVVFGDRPHLPLLQWLARGSLKQNLLRAVRLWVWIHSLYGETNLFSGCDRNPAMALSEPFTYANWRDAFFTATHPKGEQIPGVHDPQCACAKTVAAWLFDPEKGMPETLWRSALLSHHDIGENALNHLLQKRLFGVTRRSLQGDLEMLQELGWLEYREPHYYRVLEFPQYPREMEAETQRISPREYSFNFLHPDLANIALNHSQDVRGVQRFFLHVDYVIAKKTLDLVDDWQYQLRNLWEQNPVPPIQITYQSARVKKTVECMVYPVSIYYVQRAVYLCAFGETPTAAGQWYNYRLDRIQRMQPLDWNDDHLPEWLRQSYPQNLPQPDAIEEKIAQAWGFDFYLQPRWMILRFEREFDQYYIRDSFRHETFESISYEQAMQLIAQKTGNLQHQKALLKVLEKRSRQDAYYRVCYRDGDTNVGLRLRSWRPKVEVLFPWELRQSFAEEVAAEAKFYFGE